MIQEVIELDRALFEAVNGLVGRSPWLDGFMRLLVNEYFVPVSMSLVLLALWFSGANPHLRKANQRAVLYAILAQGLSAAIVAANNGLYFRPRPFATLPVNLLYYRPTDSSFPSNPAAMAFTFALVIWLFHRRAGAGLLLLALLFSFARVYCGVHLPSDILGGAVVGVIAVLLATVTLKGMVEPLFRIAIGLARSFYLA
jgi:undecaprenyl-diphosphatase